MDPKPPLILVAISVFAITLLPIVSNIILILWINKMEENNCICSEDWKRPLIKYWAIFSLFYYAVIFSLKILGFWEGKESNVSSLFLAILYLFSFLNTLAILYYISNLKDIKCECSEDMKRELVYVFEWLRFSLYTLGFIIFKIFLLYYLYVFMKVGYMRKK